MTRTCLEQRSTGLIWSTFNRPARNLAQQSTWHPNGHHSPLTLVYYIRPYAIFFNASLSYIRHCRYNSHKSPHPKSSDFRRFDSEESRIPHPHREGGAPTERSVLLCVQSTLFPSLSGKLANGSGQRSSSPLWLASLQPSSQHRQRDFSVVLSLRSFSGSIDLA